MKKFLLPILIFLVAMLPWGEAFARGESTWRYVNNARYSNSLRVYEQGRALTRTAQQWAYHMAAQGAISHNPNLEKQIPNWEWIGENVGAGATEKDVFDAMMNSPHHRDNILNHHYTLMGVGIAWRDGFVYVVEDFKQPRR